jgi:hypothetical protein
MKNGETIGSSNTNEFSAGDITDNHEQPKYTLAVNIHNAKDNFLDDSEVFEGREADSVCRRAKPNEIFKVDSYEDVMKITPDFSESLEDRFNLDPSDFPIFSKQAISAGKREDIQERILNISKTANLYLGDVITTIDVIEDSDLVIYLDKSARPVSWFVNEFWQEFSNKELPAEANLAIDRMQWFPWVGLDVGENGEIETEDGKKRKATFSDFKEHLASMSRDERKTRLARIKALFIPGGVDTEDPDEIMKMSTGLEGKKITVIDEVENSGSTAGIAKWLIEQVIPGSSVQTHVFWQPLSLHSDRDSGSDSQMNKSPVWYDPEKHDTWSGRGVLDINTGYFERNYQACPDNYTRAQMLGSVVLGEPMDIEKEPGQRSWELQREIRKMHEEYRRGHILPNVSCIESEEVQDKVCDFLGQLGIVFLPETGRPSDDANKYQTISAKMNKQWKSPMA